MRDVGACTGGEPRTPDASCMAVQVHHATQTRVHAAPHPNTVAGSQVHVDAHACMTVSEPEVGGQLGAALREANNGEATLATDGVLTGIVRHALEEGVYVSARRPIEISVDEVITFGGVPDPMGPDRRSSNRVQSQPDVDDLQIGRAMRAARMKDVKNSTGMSINTEHSILHFSPQDIIDNATSVGVILGSNSKEISKSINDLLDLEVDRALDIIRTIAAIKPMNDEAISNMGGLNLLCDNLVSTEDREEPQEGLQIDQQPNAILHEGAENTTGYMDQEYVSEKPKRTYKRRVYTVSAIRRSARFKTAKKFHDEI